MPGRKGARHMAAKVRSAAEGAIQDAYGKGGIAGMRECLADIIRKDGPAKFLEVLARYCPKEHIVEDDSDRVMHVIGAAPADVLEWARQQGLPAPVTVDAESGEVVEEDGDE